MVRYRPSHVDTDHGGTDTGDFMDMSSKNELKRFWDAALVPIDVHLF